jgi:hypothetical protein
MGSKEQNEKITRKQNNHQQNPPIWLRTHSNAIKIT